MADNVNTQSTLLSTLPDGTKIGTAVATFSGDANVQIGLAALAEITGAEGSRSAAIISPATSGKQDTGNTSLASIDSKLTNPLPVSSDGLTDTELRAAPIDVLGPLTDTELRASAVPVSGPLTDTQLRATPVPVSGSVTTGGLTDAQLRATPVPVTANAGTNLNTSALALEAGNLATVKSNTDPLVASGGGGYVRQDSTATIAKETGGNLATVKTNTDPLVTSGGGGYVRQDSTGTIAKETGGNLASIKTNTDKIPSQGQALMAASTPVAIASNQSAIPVTLASAPTTAVTIADGADVTLGAKADAKSSATDTTPISAMSVLKQISASVQAPPSQAVTNAGTFAVQATEADGANVTLGAKADARSTATDTTAITAMQVLKEISFMEQNPASRAVTNAGTFAVQAAATIADGADVTLGAIADLAVTAGATGTISAKLRSISRDLVANIVLAAGTNLIGRVSASDETNTIYNGTTALTPKFAKISTSTSGASEVVAAVTAKKIRVTQVVLMANAAVNVKFQSHVTPTDLTGLLYLAANTGFAPGYDPTGHFETVAGEALDINLSGAQAVGGWIKYVEV